MKLYELLTKYCSFLSIFKLDSILFIAIFTLAVVIRVLNGNLYNFVVVFYSIEPL